MQIENIWVSQRQLRNVAQVVSMQIALSRGFRLPPVTVACCEDGSYQLEDGHHRLVAYWLSGLRELSPSQLFTVEKDQWKPRFGRIDNLLDRILVSIKQ
jgi:ParB-like nuclease domain